MKVLKRYFRTALSWIGFVGLISYFKQMSLGLFLLTGG